MANGTATGRRFGIFTAVERMIAFRYLRPRRKEGFISVIAGFSFLGIALGVATLIIVMSVMNGFRHELLSRVLGFNGHIVLSGVGGPIRNYPVLLDRLKKVDGVESVIGVVDGQVMATINNRSTGAYVRGIDPKVYADHKLLGGKTRAATLGRFRGQNSIILGYRMANAIGAATGDRIKLISPDGTPTPVGVVPRIKSYRMVGTFNVGMSEYDRAYIFMPLEAAQVFFKKQNALTGIEIRIADPDKAEEVARRIVALELPNIRLRTWQEVHSTFFNALKVERNVMFLILTLIIVVAAFNIISSMIMLVKDKTQAIAILRTMGATRGMVMRVFFLSGASIGFFGTALGVGLGIAIADNIEAIRKKLESWFDSTLFPPEIYFLTRMPSIIETDEVLQVAIMGLVLSFLATLYPSWRAARLDPVEALRNE